MSLSVSSLSLFAAALMAKADVFSSYIRKHVRYDENDVIKGIVKAGEGNGR